MSDVRPKTIIAEAVPENLPGQPAVVYARGGHDAHLRLAVLLAAQAAPEGADRARALSLKASWAERRESLFAALDSKRAQRVVLVDPDAAHVSRPRGRAVFDDATHGAERARFFSDLAQFGLRAGWIFVRTAPRSEVSQEIAWPDVQVEGEGELIPGLAPSLQPLARWMIGRGLSRDGLGRLLDAATDDADRADALLSLFEDVLGADARDGLRRICLLREEHPINGVAGPFGPGAEAGLQIAPEVLELLRASGALGVRRVQGGEVFAVPSVLRDWMARRMSLVEPERAREVRRKIAERAEGGTVAASLEAHRQAILCGDLALARRSSRYYGTDLREIALRLSQRASETRRENPARDPGQGRALYRQAAALYREIVTEYDASDAYAWHYLGFNRMLASRAGGRIEEEAQPEIMEAFQRSCALSDATRYNPLYHGRRLAFEVACGRGAALLPEIRHHIEKTRAHYGREDVRWLVSPLLRRTGASSGLRAALLSAYPWLEQVMDRRERRAEAADEEV